MKRNSVDVHLLIWGFKLVCNKEYCEVEEEKMDRLINLTCDDN